MEELRNEVMSQEDIEEVNELMEMENSDVPLETSDCEVVEEKNNDAGAIGLGLAVGALAVYGTVQLTKNVVIPGAKAGAGLVKKGFGKLAGMFKKDDEVEIEDDEYFDDAYDDFNDEEESKEEKTK